METPQIGQRWLVDTDASLGLGILVDCEPRRLTLEFPATSERRYYSRNNPPLTRVKFVKGDLIETEDGKKHTVAHVEVISNLLIYINQDGDPIPESKLASKIQFNHPLKRLLAAQLDKPDWFSVREQLALAHQKWRRSDVVGLVGARITLTAHQIYVAYSATSRFPVRVLLADQVGLGKTIEAGLILQRLQRQELVSRALILVPEALCVQWFVELLRGFAIHSRLVNTDTDLNDACVFIAEHSFIEEARCLSTDPWDMVIVDEAHHFDLVASNPKAAHLQQLSQHTTHLLLVSATPERLGLLSHFALLELLDSNKFHDFNEFSQAYEGYQSLADDLQLLLDGSDEAITNSLHERLQQHFDITINPQMSKDNLLELLLDTHGTGRVVYRNTRHGVTGFPERQLVSHKLESQEQKFNWLADFMKIHRHEKLLLIAHEKQTVLDIKVWLYRNVGFDCPVFHEDMTLIERDRAAAYFADAEEGAPLLLCSEIGSEGRNFQFCHQLICWDLPEHPDVLEQRIGRLDRIGQTQNIEVHVCVADPEQSQRLHWFHDLLGCIETINPAAGAIHEKYYAQYCANPGAIEEATVKQEAGELLQSLEQGRDRLLEINSCRQPQADQLIANVSQQHIDNHPQELLEKIADVLNLHYEYLAENRYKLIPSDQMLVSGIPGIPREGCEITFDRATAIAREEITFITWDHPLMQGLHEMISLSELGVASVGILPNNRLKPGMLFAEVLFTLSVQSSYSHQIERYLTDSCLRILVTSDVDKNLAQSLPASQLERSVTTAPRSLQQKLVKDFAKQITELIDKAHSMATMEMDSIIKCSQKQLKDRSQLEVSRLQQLQRHNADIHNDDINQCLAEYKKIAEQLESSCQPILSAIRLLITDR